MDQEVPSLGASGGVQNHGFLDVAKGSIASAGGNATDRMNSSEVISKSDATASVPGEYGEALLEAARRQPRKSTYGETGGGGDHGRSASRPAAVRPASSATPVTRPTPMPKRPKGRLFVAATLLTIGAVVLFAVWDSLFRYSARGIISGKTVDVSSPWPGVLRTLHVRDGDEVRQGDLLATVVNLELEQRADKLADDLRIAQADLEAELVKLRFQALSREDQGQQAESEYYAMWGELVQEQSKLASLVARRMRVDALQEKIVVSVEELDAIRFGEAGLRSKIEKLTLAVEELKRRVDRASEVPPETHGQLRPFLTRIEVLQDQLLRAREQVRWGDIRSPVNGRVIQAHRFSGEYADESQPIVQILIDGSIEAVFYVSQDAADQYPAGQDLDVIIPPAKTPTRGVVVRVGDELEEAPHHLRRYFNADARLLPIHVKLDLEDRHRKLMLGGEVRLPLRSAGGDLAGLRSFLSKGSVSSQGQPGARTSAGASP